MSRFKHLINRWSRTPPQRTANRDLQHKQKNRVELSRRLDDNLQLLQEVYADCSDVIFHDFWIGDQTRAALIYIDGLTNTEEVDQHVLAPLQQSFHHEPTLLNMRKKIAVSSIKQVETIADVFTEISDGNPVLFLPVFITLFLLVIVPITTDLQLSNLFPIMGEGIRPSIEGAFVLQTWYSEMIIASIFLPFVADQNNANKNVLRSLLAIMATLVI